ncbi:MAG: methyltransferase [Frankiales bacterium]|nr:methyltransferase [Frankiales bacterium]
MIASWRGASLSRLREALRSGFTADQVAETLGLAGEALLSRGDLVGVRRLLTATTGTTTGTWLRLFVLGEPVSTAAAVAALSPFTLAEALTPGPSLPALLRRCGTDGVRAGLDLRPYREAAGPDWWILSDLGSDVSGQPVDADHVLGVGQAATTLAQATVRAPVRRALDVGTGCGVQALHLGRHAESVVATDLSERALAMAATTAALNGLDWDLRQGSLLDPVAGEEFDLIVCNPPFIVGPGFTPSTGGYTYRDGGLSGDELCRRLVGDLPARLAPGGTAQLLANWCITAEGSWPERIGGWLGGSGCDAWVWQREVADPAEYVTMWLRDSGRAPADPDWPERYDDWLGWFERAGVLGVGMGMLNLRRTDSATPVVLCEDVPQAMEQPVGGDVNGWFERQRWLRSHGEDALRSSRLVVAADLVSEVRSLAGPDGWVAARSVLRQSHGLRWEIETDAAVSGLVGACDGHRPLGLLVDVLAGARGLDPTELWRDLRPVVLDLLSRGVLLPPGE